MTSLGVKPDCSRSTLEYFKTLLGIRKEYPDERVFAQLKSIGVQKLLKKTAPSVSVYNSPSPVFTGQKYDKDFSSAIQGRSARPKTHDDTRVPGLDGPGTWLAGSVHEASRDLLNLLLPYEDRFSVNRYVYPSNNYIPTNSTRKLQRDLEDPDIELGYITDQSYMTPPQAGGGFYMRPSVAFLNGPHHTGPQIGEFLVPNESSVPEDVFQEARAAGSFVEQLFAQAIQMAASTSSSHKTENIVEDMMDDVKLARFLNGAFVGKFIDGAVKHVDLKLGANVTLVMESPMINIGAALCESSSFSFRTDPVNVSVDSCAVATLLRNYLACRDKSSPKVECNKLDGYASFMIPCEKFNQIPGNFTLEVDIDTESSNISTNQGNIDRWLFNAANILYRYSRWESACSVSPSKIMFLPGWKAIGIHQMDSRNLLDLSDEERHKIPHSVLLQHGQKPCEFILLSRGTHSMSDWLIDFQTQQLNLTVNQNHLGRAHAGFANIAAPTAAYSAKQIRCLTRGVCLPNEIKVTTSGHSLGAGVSIVAALLFTEWLPQAKISSVAFATPNALDAKATSILQERVSVRSWVNEFDAVPMMPCAIPEGQLRCPAMTGDDSNMRDFYVPTPNSVNIESSDIGKLLPKFLESTFGEIQYDLHHGVANLSNFRTPGPGLISEAHTCVYACLLDSQYCFEGADAIKRACSRCV